MAKCHGVPRLGEGLLALIFGLILLLIFVATATRTLGLSLDGGERREDDDAENFQEGIHA